MRIHQFSSEVWLARPTKRRSFFLDPANLDSITPPWLNFRLDYNPCLERKVCVAACPDSEIASSSRKAWKTNSSGETKRRRGGQTYGVKAVVCGMEKRRENLWPDEQTEANPAQSRERLENAGKRHLCRPTDCLGKPLRGRLAADER